MGNGAFLIEVLSQTMDIINSKNILENFAVLPEKKPYYTYGAGSISGNLSSVTMKLGVYLEKPKAKELENMLNQNATQISVELAEKVQEFPVPPR